MHGKMRVVQMFQGSRPLAVPELAQNMPLLGSPEPFLTPTASKSIPTDWRNSPHCATVLFIVGGAVA